MKMMEHIDIEEFKKNIKAQKQKVDDAINPIFQLYKEGKLTKIELVEKLADAFHKLEEDCEQ